MAYIILRENRFKDTVKKKKKKKGHMKSPQTQLGVGFIYFDLD